MPENDDGADFLPMKLAAVLVAASIAVALAITSVHTLTDQSSTTEARACATRIVGMAMAEYADGCPDGDGNTLTGLSVPGNVRMITFGKAPVNDPVTRRTGMYTIEYKDGTNEAWFTGAPLGDGSPGPYYGKPVVLYPGRYSVNIRIRPVNGTMMALICPEAA